MTAEGTYNAHNDTAAEAQVFLALVQLLYKRRVQVRPIADVISVICDSEWTFGHPPRFERVTEVGLASVDSRSLPVVLPQYPYDQLTTILRPEHMVVVAFQDHFNPAYRKKGVSQPASRPFEFHEGTMNVMGTGAWQPSPATHWLEGLPTIGRPVVFA